jgi:tetratricopeptide (TPR) repeat protein
VSAGFEACFEQARELRAGGRLAEAVMAYEAALALRPASPEAHFNRANALQALHRHDEAVAAYDALLMLHRADAQALNNRAVSLLALGRAGEAAADCQAALLIRPGYAAALHNRGNALAQLGRLDEALASVASALEQQPDHAAAWSSRGRMLQRARRHDEALAAFETALRLRPGDPVSLCDHGNALQALGRPAEALASLDAALAVAPASLEAWVNRGNTLAALGRHQEALASYARARALDPADPEVLWNEALARLALGDYEGGWPLYEARWRVPALGLAPRAADQPRWSGREDVAGRTVLLHAEQGFGDAIQFVRYAREVAARGARVIVATAPALQPLFTHADGVAQAVVPGREPLPTFDFHAPLMSLPLAFGTTLATIPPAPYLSVPAEQVQGWRTRLGQPHLGVGLAWSGNPDFPAARLKACPPEALASLVGTEGCCFVSLQFGAARDGVSELGPGVLDATDELLHFGVTAALISALDLVITVDTAVAHLAGALGRPVWILLPYAADWRWLTGRADSPWYPSARLYRQAAPGDWTGVLQRVERDLQQWSRHGQR